MTKDEAVDLAVEWWVRMIVSGRWDNGDATSELHHGSFVSLMPKATQADLDKCRPYLRALLYERADKTGWASELYADYGCAPLDDVYAKAGVKLSSTFHCPQKAGTKFERVDNQYRVVAKTGYGADWELLKA